MNESTSKAAKLLGKLGGEATSASKAEASRLNGAKGGRPRKETKKMSESLPSVLGATLEMLNQIEREGMIQKPTIGGSVALMHYTQPMYTEDLDMFCYFPNQGLLTNLGPVYKRLKELGCHDHGLYINIKGVDVQLLPAETPLAKEGYQNAVAITINNVSTHVLEYEYALAIKASANRPKDWAQIATAIEAATPNKKKLDAILNKYGLLEKWRRKTEE